MYIFITHLFTEYVI
ncbi:TPA: stress response small protein YobI, partial [Shigella sonnei]|nr:stress response small protein YobI [Shigella sonnei]